MNHFNGTVPAPSHGAIPFAGTIGTDDPNRWFHVLWFDGDVYVAELFDDVLSHIPTYEELRGHFDRCNGERWEKLLLVLEVKAL